MKMKKAAKIKAVALALGTVTAFVGGACIPNNFWANTWANVLTTTVDTAVDVFVLDPIVGALTPDDGE